MRALTRVPAAAALLFFVLQIFWLRYAGPSQPCALQCLVGYLGAERSELLQYAPAAAGDAELYRLTAIALGALRGGATIVVLRAPALLSATALLVMLGAVSLMIARSRRAHDAWYGPAAAATAIGALSISPGFLRFASAPGGEMAGAALMTAAFLMPLLSYMEKPMGSEGGARRLSLLLFLAALAGLFSGVSAAVLPVIAAFYWSLISNRAQAINDMARVWPAWLLWSAATVVAFLIEPVTEEAPFSGTAISALGFIPVFLPAVLLVPGFIRSSAVAGESDSRAPSAYALVWATTAAAAAIYALPNQVFLLTAAAGAALFLSLHGVEWYRRLSAEAQRRLFTAVRLANRAALTLLVIAALGLALIEALPSSYFSLRRMELQILRASALPLQWYLLVLFLAYFAARKFGIDSRWGEIISGWLLLVGLGSVICGWH